MELDRPHWKMPFAEEPVVIRRGMHLRDRAMRRFYRVLRLEFTRKIVHLRSFFDTHNLAPVSEPEIEVSFDDVMAQFTPTLYGDGTELQQPLSAIERIQSGKLFT
jgi:hypothetical protein